MSDDPIDVGDSAQVKEVRKSTGLREREEGDAFAAFMSSPIGRRYIFHLLEQCHIFVSSFSSDPGRMAFSEGERNIGIRLVADIMRWCPNRYSEMMQEANADVGSRKPNTDAARRGNIADTPFGLGYEFNPDPDNT